MLIAVPTVLSALATVSMAFLAASIQSGETLTPILMRVVALICLLSLAYAMRGASLHPLLLLPIVPLSLATVLGCLALGYEFGGELRILSKFHWYWMVPGVLLSALALSLTRERDVTAHLATARNGSALFAALALAATVVLTIRFLNPLGLEVSLFSRLSWAVLFVVGLPTWALAKARSPVEMVAICGWFLLVSAI